MSEHGRRKVRSEQPSGIHHRCEIRNARSKLPLCIFLPSNSGWSTFDGVSCDVNDSEATLPFGGWEFRVAPAENADGGGLGWVESTEVCEEVAKWPARILGVGGGVDEGDGVLWGDRELGRRL